MVFKKIEFYIEMLSVAFDQVDTAKFMLHMPNLNFVAFCTYQTRCVLSDIKTLNLYSDLTQTNWVDGAHVTVSRQKKYQMTAVTAQ